MPIEDPDAFDSDQFFGDEEEDFDIEDEFGGDDIDDEGDEDVNPDISAVSDIAPAAKASEIDDANDEFGGEDLEDEEEIDLEALSNEALRANQMATYQTDPDNVVVKDDVQAQTGEKVVSSDALKSVWMPLILDTIGLEPWTSNEIVQVMTPIIRAIANKNSGHRAVYDKEDAFQVGLMSILTSLKNDKGKSPIFYMIVERAKKAIVRGVYSNPLIGQRTRRQRYVTKGGTDLGYLGQTGHSDANVASTDAPAGTDADSATIGSNLGGDQGTTTRKECPTCKGARVVVDPLTDEEEVCPMCGGMGYLVVGSNDTKKDLTPDEQKIADEEMAEIRGKLSNLIVGSNLSQRQIETVLLMHGAESVYDPSLPNTGGAQRAIQRQTKDSMNRRHKDEAEGKDIMHRQPTEIASILAPADEIMTPANIQAGIKDDKGLWPYAVENGTTDQFQEAWRKVMDGIEGATLKEFNPDIPASLQISIVYDVGQLDTLMNELRTSVYTPEDTMAYAKKLSHDAVKAGGGDLDAGIEALQQQGKFPGYMEEPVRAVHGEQMEFTPADAEAASKIVPIKTMSKQNVYQQVKKAMKRLETAAAKDKSASECVDKLKDAQYDAIIESIGNGTADLESIRALGYL